ncbi:cytochrome P450 [Aspergillus saccharolyticus JOP 1030-1]|uniref:Cytochrome P450 n=1 Tax=Aspergillus saccharolyticus JOP 1030-1 TaxID=1450539 RepID=A0A318YZJ8_9EURO|nr:cytochrome P450 [Aspergillus saccharolyticus JOP 1030-1]PYH40405.1 cytochrome P450 [Aspergillus saccharolyticus JOP 1030-1]
MLSGTDLGSILGVFGALWLIYQWLVPGTFLSKLGSPERQLPPGPRGLPIVGNMFQFTKARDAGLWAPFLASLLQYGPMTTLHMGSQTWVVLNDPRVVNDIINKHGKITHERPEMPVAGTLVSHGLRTVIRPTAGWTEGRRVMHHLLSGSVLRVYGNWQEIASLQMLAAYLREPTRWYAHHYRYSIAVLYRLVMGEHLDKTQTQLDEYQQVTMEFTWSLLRSFVDYFPQCDRWVPTRLQWWRPGWAQMGDRHHRVLQAWWDPIRTAVRNGTAKPGFVRDTLLHPAMRYKGGEEEAMYLATSVIAAGSDNTRMTLNTFLMAMISHPETMARARKDMDALCVGPDGALRLPGMADWEQLPYLAAMVKEVLRWRPTTPITPQHQLTEDLEYAGYRFPKGTCFVINGIALSQQCEEPDRFDPSRWMDGNEGNITHGLWAFGGGRRICVGYRVAQQALYIAMARIIYCFDLVSEGPVNTRKLNHFSLHQQPFPVKVTVRSPQHEQLIQQEVATTGNVFPPM